MKNNIASCLLETANQLAVSTFSSTRTVTQLLWISCMNTYSYIQPITYVCMHAGMCIATALLTYSGDPLLPVHADILDSPQQVLMISIPFTSAWQCDVAFFIAKKAI